MPHPKSGYHLKDGTRVPGTTTIIGRFKDSSALLYWACEQGKAIERGEIGKLYDRRDAAAEAGTIAHGLVECHINNDDPAALLDGVSPDVGKKAKQAFESYLMWERTTNLKIVEQEMELVSELYKFGGCPDAIGEIDGKLTLVDWKTSNSVYQDMLIQLAAYKQLWEENFPDRPLYGFHLCRFSKEHGDFAHHYYSELDDAWEQFKLFRQAYELDKLLKKRV
jgi:hypothetical protein